MRIAFYAPMKAPDAPHPSGDRRMARLLMAALERSGHEARLASRFRSWSAAPDPVRLDRLANIGGRLADRFLARVARGVIPTPDIWFTYHVYYKAPDWIGPPVSRALGIPYVIAEAAHAPKRGSGPWATGHEAAAAAIRDADAIIGLNPSDTPCVAALLDDPGRIVPLPPFLDDETIARPGVDRAGARAALLRETGFDGTAPIALTVAMMRPGEKLDSYRVLAGAVARLAATRPDRRFDLALIGDGPERSTVEAMFGSPARERIRFLGERPVEAVTELLAGGDFFLWPAVGEAYGMAVLEAQSAGLPVVAGAGGGVAAIVRDGETGLLAPVGDANAFAAMVAALIDDPARMAGMGAAARRNVAAHHSLGKAAMRLDAILAAVRQRRAA